MNLNFVCYRMISYESSLSYQVLTTEVLACEPYVWVNIPIFLFCTVWRMLIAQYFSKWLLLSELLCAFLYRYRVPGFELAYVSASHLQNVYVPQTPEISHMCSMHIASSLVLVFGTSTKTASSSASCGVLGWLFQRESSFFARLFE